ncbi:putative transcription factor C3H family [Medicago truncatula]|uniref:Putative transcription factor C3H family n=1 Tax=Medicago truncatula TaxID=3880 RepID=A0A396IQN7_MEDTR|nr:putative transcription factor C3H family [Medicago truncatula]
MTFPMNKRRRISEKNYSNAFICPPPSNKETGSIFFKTRICHKFKFGNCPKGEHCTYAHGVGEIRQPPANWKDLAGPRNEEWMQFLDDDEKIIHKMGLCKKYYNGEECPYGDTCIFLHRLREDSWKSREACALSIGSIGDGSNNLEGNRSVNKPARGTYWKIKLCPIGDDCHYAYGEAVFDCVWFLLLHVIFSCLVCDVNLLALLR